MTACERDNLRERILSYMEYYPLRMPIISKRTRSFEQYTKRVSGLFGSRTVRFRAIAGAFVLLFFIIVPLVAEQALPGDTLYPIKVRFNEGIRSQLLFSPYEKMQWETKRVERRIAEARLLVKEGKLTEEKVNTLEEIVRAHAAAFQAQLAELRESDAMSAAIAEVTLESALDVQSAVLNTEIAEEASSTSPNEGDVSGLAAIVREARADVASSTDEASGIASYEPLTARVEENTTRIHALSQSLMNELTESQKTEIQERTTRVNADIVAAKKVHEVAENDAAITLLRNTLATTEKLIAFMSSIDLRSNVLLDTLVPQQVPDETLKTGLAETLALFAEKHASLVVAISTLEEPQRTDAIEQLGKLTMLLEKSTNEMMLGNLKEAQRIVMDVGVLIADLENRQQR